MIELAVGIPASADSMKNISWAKVEPCHDDWFSIQKRLDLSSGMSLSRLRSSFEDFAGRLAALHLDLDLLHRKAKKKV